MKVELCFCNFNEMHVYIMMFKHVHHHEIEMRMPVYVKDMLFYGSCLWLGMVYRKESIEHWY